MQLDKSSAPFMAAVIVMFTAMTLGEGPHRTWGPAAVSWMIFGGVVAWFVVRILIELFDE